LLKAHFFALKNNPLLTHFFRKYVLLMADNRIFIRIYENMFLKKSIKKAIRLKNERPFV